MDVTGVNRSIYFDSDTLSRAVALQKELKVTRSELIRKLIAEKYEKIIKKIPSKT